MIFKDSIGGEKYNMNRDMSETRKVVKVGQYLIEWSEVESCKGFFEFKTYMQFRVLDGNHRTVWMFRFEYGWMYQMVGNVTDKICDLIVRILCVMYDLKERVLS